MMGQTLHAISMDSAIKDRGAEIVRPIQTPLRVATETQSHKHLYMPSRLTVNGVSAFISSGQVQSYSSIVGLIVSPLWPP